MIGAAVHLQLGELLATQAILGNHPPDGPADGLFGLLGQEGAVGPGTQTARVARVVVNILVGVLGARQHDLFGVDDHHVVTGVDMGREGRLVLAAQDRCDLGRHTTEDHALGVDDVPDALDFTGPGGVGGHG